MTQQEAIDGIVGEVLRIVGRYDDAEITRDTMAGDVRSTVAYHVNQFFEDNAIDLDIIEVDEEENDDDNF